MIPPDWLTLREGAMGQSTDGRSWFVFFGGKPHYKLVPGPADGKFTCRISQTENGRRIDKACIYQTAEDALIGGLKELQAYLGW